MGKTAVEKGHQDNSPQAVGVAGRDSETVEGTGKEKLIDEMNAPHDGEETAENEKVAFQVSGQFLAATLLTHPNNGVMVLGITIAHSRITGSSVGDRRPRA